MAGPAARPVARRGVARRRAAVGLLGRRVGALLAARSSSLLVERGRACSSACPLAPPLVCMVEEGVVIPSVPARPPPPLPGDRCVRGRPLPNNLCTTLLRALREELRWPAARRRGVDCDAYVTLGRSSRAAGARHDPSGVVWRAVSAAVEAVLPGWRYTQVALARGFRGSPHCDAGDVTWQLALSLGTAEAGTGRLCLLDEGHRVVRCDTHQRCVRVLRRHPPNWGG